MRFLECGKLFSGEKWGKVGKIPTFTYRIDLSCTNESINRRI